MSEVQDPLTGPVAPNVPADVAPVTAPRLARHQVELADGHIVGIAVAGHGIPLVVVHGFSAEGFLYAQTLSRLVSMGFKVIAIDVAGHGGTQGLPYSGQSLPTYAELLGRVIDELGIERYVLAGHSMGGRLVTQLAAADPDRVIALMLIDAIVGDTWDKMVYAFRLSPPLLAGVGTALIVDSLTIFPTIRNPVQAVKFARLLVPTVVGHVMRPWRLLGPLLSILRSRSSRYALDVIAEAEVPVFVLHGDRDFPVPHRTAREASKRAGGTLITIKGAGHSWLLRDPETMPAIFAHLLPGELGEAIRRGLRRAGVRSKDPSIDRIEQAMYADGARILALTPLDSATRIAGRHHRPKFEWTVSKPLT